MTEKKNEKKNPFGSALKGASVFRTDTYEPETPSRFRKDRDEDPGRNDDPAYGRRERDSGRNDDNAYGMRERSFGRNDDTEYGRRERSFGRNDDNAYGRRERSSGWNDDNAYGRRERDSGRNDDNAYGRRERSSGRNDDNAYGRRERDSGRNDDNAYGRRERSSGRNDDTAYGRQKRDTGVPDGGYDGRDRRNPDRRAGKSGSIRPKTSGAPRQPRGYHVGADGDPFGSGTKSFRETTEEGIRDKSPEGPVNEERRPGPWLANSSVAASQRQASGPEKRRSTGVFAKMTKTPVSEEDVERALRNRRELKETAAAEKAAEEAMMSERRSGPGSGKDLGDGKEKRQKISREAFERQKTHPASDFLPMSKEEMTSKGWDAPDIILITGDAYVDHPGFGTAIIGRVLEKEGFRVAVMAQPDPQDPEAFRALGKPKLFFSVSAGNADSLVNNYTPLLYPRKTDVYSPGGQPGLRPDRAVISYSNMVHRVYPDVPIIAGGIEASLRRFAEFDYLSNKVRQSVLADAPVDMIVYGMGELQITEIAGRLKAGEDIHAIRNIPGTVWKLPVKEWKSGKGKEGRPEDGCFPDDDYLEIPSFEEVAADKKTYAEAFRTIYENLNHVTGKNLIQPHPKTIIVQNRPMRPLTTEEIDRVYELPYTREAHPSYEEPVPGLDIVRLSITTHRGCFGGCSFCAIAQHQGIEIVNRSEESILREAELITKLPGFNGIINGVGGPSANMYGMSCRNWKTRGACTNKSCLYPKLCPSMNADHRPLLQLLEKMRAVPGVRKVLTGYGVRFDLAVLDDEYMETLCRYHVGGQLKVAPEHFCDNVTSLMRKPGHAVFERFDEKFKEINERIGMKQFLVTFQISGHPGCTPENAVEMAEYIRDHNRYTEQVQDFTPTPMTISTCMFHTGLDPFTMEPVYVPATRTEKKAQRALLQYKAPQNYFTVRRILTQLGRKDLIGDGPECLIRKDPPEEIDRYSLSDQDDDEE